jgi:hypothetical protein
MSVRGKAPLDPTRGAARRRGDLAGAGEHRVDYVVIGGLAVQAHGHTRTTQDLDLGPEPSEENRKRLRAALRALGVRPVGARRPIAVTIPGAGVLELDTDGGIDVHIAPRRRALR